MADTYIDFTVSTYGFGDVYIPQVLNDVDLGVYYSRYARGVNQPASVLDLRSVFVRLPNYDGGSYQTLNAPLTWDEVNTDAYVQAQEDFESHVVWLWGSLKNGGCFCMKNADGSGMAIGICYGWFEVEYANAPGISKYNYQMRATNYYTMNTVHNVAITFNRMLTTESVDEGMTIQEPQFHVYVQGIDAPVDIRDVAPIILLPPIATYPEGRDGSLVEAMAVPSYISAEFRFVSPIEDNAPERIWFPTYMGILGMTIPNATIKDKQGSWTGGREINTGIDPYDGGGTASPSGGRGSYPTKSDTTLPQDPNASGTDAIGSGFITLYNPTKAQVKAFNDYLFSDSITEAIAETFKKLIADPIDYLVFIAMCHFHPNATEVNEEITFCGLGTGIFCRLIGHQIEVIDCGKIDLTEPTASFMDYSPNSKISMFIPYVGFRELPNDEVMGGVLGLKYHVDLLTGAFIAQVTVERPTRPQFPRDATPGFNTIVAQYEGNCYEMLPLSSTDFRQMFSGILGIGAGVASTALGNPMAGIGTIATSMMSMKANVQKSGNASSSYGYIGRQRAFIIITRPFQSIPAQFGGYEGYPSNMQIAISQCVGSASNNYNDGYLETDPDTVWGTDIYYTYNNTTITATDGEIDEIKDLFNKGVIVNV